MRLTFYTPAHGAEAGSFGAATFGFADAENAQADTARDFPRNVEGQLYTGSYAEILREIPRAEWQAGIALLGNAGGENSFIHSLFNLVRCPLTGGGAAIDPRTGRAGMISGGGEAAVFLIRDGCCDVRVRSENIHRDILGAHRLGLRGPRELAYIDGVAAADWPAGRKRELGLPESDFEHLTFADEAGMNAHLSRGEGCLQSGRDLQERMLLRFLPPKLAYDRARAFYDDEDAIVFGCAGLKSVLPAPLNTRGLGLFMFGEVCMGPHGAEFGNLMLSKMIITKRGRAADGQSI